MAKKGDVCRAEIDGNQGERERERDGCQKQERSGLKEGDMQWVESEFKKHNMFTDSVVFVYNYDFRYKRKRDSMP